jgi:hypothetical protein
LYLFSIFYYFFFFIFFFFTFFLIKSNFFKVIATGNLNILNKSNKYDKFTTKFASLFCLIEDGSLLKLSFIPAVRKKAFLTGFLISDFTLTFLLAISY